MRSRSSFRASGTRRGAAFALLCLVSAGVACSGGDGASSTMPAAPFRALLRSPPAVGPPCEAHAPEALGGSLALSLFVAREVPQRQALQVLASLPAVFRSYGVELALTEPVRTLDANALIVGGTRTQALAPLARLLHEVALPERPAQVNVVIAPAIATKDSPAARYFTRLEGFTLAPAMRGSDDDALYRALGLPRRFTPTILLGARAIAHRRPGDLDLSAAHELGHALGLSHESGRNLMSTQPKRCVPTLTQEQRSRVRATLTP